MAFAKVWYDIYDDRREHVATLILRKSHIKSKILHRVPEFIIIGNDETTNIGRIYPFSTDLERSEYGQAVAVKSMYLKEMNHICVFFSTKSTFSSTRYES